MPDIALRRHELVDQGRELAGIRNKTKAERQLFSWIVYRLKVRSMMSVPDIAYSLDCPINDIARIVKEMTKTIIKETKLDAEMEVQLQIQMLERMLQLATEAYERSIGVNVTLTESGSKPLEDDQMVSLSIQEAIDQLGDEEDEEEAQVPQGDVRYKKVTKIVNGDIRYLTEMRAIMKDLRALKGIADPPKSVEVHNVVEGSVEHIVTQGQPDTKKLDEVVMLLIKQGALPAPPGFELQGPVIEAEYTEEEDED